MNRKLRSAACFSPFAAPPSLPRVFFASLLCLAAFALACPSQTIAQETPYFVAYSHHLEEPGNLEVEFNSIYATQKGGNDLIAPWMEFEYGATGWWTTEVYLDTQTTFGDSTLFTGYRWENRFRLLMNEHRINPVFYVEYENINEADKTFKEVVGFDSGLDNVEPNAETRREIEREIETKLILSSDIKGWNISENLIAEKNLIAPDPWEFGYAFGANRPLALAASPRDCNFCRENFRAGVEIFGGLGDRHNFTFRGTSHYFAPLLSWTLVNGTTLRFSPAFGLTPQSHRALIRVGISYELPAFGRRVHQMFR